MKSLIVPGSISSRRTTRHMRKIAVLAAISTMNAPFAATPATALSTEKLLKSQLPANTMRLPLMRQATDYTCGIAALQSVLSYYGDDVREETLAKQLKADHRNGTAYKQIVRFATSKGYTVDFASDLNVDKLRQWLNEKRPVICLIQAWREIHSEKHWEDHFANHFAPATEHGTEFGTTESAKRQYSSDWDDGHYVVAIGIDEKNIYFMDPSVSGHYAYIPISEFPQRWHDIDGKTKLNHFGMAVSKPNMVPDTETIEPIE